ncbi:unnamed protein product [Caenorhabditis angaria]|uniref:Uncharacterized protein n=1 Tax=Caenorhabditis angaria TaxID=860376 RepID=A0A9P1N4I7_9PELO|nr:unnamed protein product [Caenorhabditis angaria]
MNQTPNFLQNNERDLMNKPDNLISAPEFADISIWYAIIPTETDHNYPNNINFPIEFIITEKCFTNQEEEEIVEPMIKRAKKSEMQNLSRDDLLERRREQARKNSNNYNDRRKQKREELSEELEKNQIEMETLRRFCENMIENIRNLQYFILNYQPTSQNQGYFDLQHILSLENQIKMIENQKLENCRKIENLENIQKCERNFELHQRKYDIANRNWNLKQGNPNTLGSTKSRAKSEMEHAENKLKLAKIQAEIQIFKEFQTKLEQIKEFCREQFISYVNIKNIKLHEKIQMRTEDFERFEKILAFFGLPDPNPS